MANPVGSSSDATASMNANFTNIKDALSALVVTKDVQNVIKNNLAEWKTFGTMNSHIYRSQLFTSMSTSNLSSEEKFMVMFLFSVIKNRDRILKALDQMGDDVKSQTWFNNVRSFISTKVTQYVTAANRTGRFPAVNIPSTMPGLDILVYCLTTAREERSLETMSRRTTFAQLNLNTEMQTMAKAGYEYYWNEVVKGTNNTDQTEAPKMREEYYKNPASDRYNLVQVDSDTGNLSELAPADASIGFTRAEIEAFMARSNI